MWLKTTVFTKFDELNTMSLCSRGSSSNSCYLGHVKPFYDDDDDDEAGEEMR